MLGSHQPPSDHEKACDLAGRPGASIGLANRPPPEPRLRPWSRKLLLLVIVAALILYKLSDGYTPIKAPTTESFRPSTTIKSTNLTDLVQWDGYSLFIEGQRIYLWSGELHPWRVPPSLWPDVMSRIKALGFNAISMYVFWGLHNPAPGVMDFDGWKDLGPFFRAANAAGLWVVARPGPYINAEVAGGGIPGWVTAQNVSLRTCDSVFKDKAAYEPYWTAIGDILARHQISQGGPIISVQVENEYFLDSEGSLDLDYIVDLERGLRRTGIVVPITFNDIAREYRLYQGKGAADIYGLDSYPQRTQCDDVDAWNQVQDYRSYLETTSGKVGMPFYIPEFQAGWIPEIDTVEYDNCLGMFGTDFQRVFYLNNIAQGIKMHNIYMVYGGTNYGHTAYPRGISSYDYWAPISEDRSLKDKYYDLKLISHFVRSARDLPKTWFVDRQTTDPVAPEGVRVDELRNPDTDAGFYVVRHGDSTSRRRTAGRVHIRDKAGQADLLLVLNGRDSRILVSNYCWGKTCILHSSASILTSTTIGNADVLVLYGEVGEHHQVAFPVSHHRFSLDAQSGFEWSEREGRHVLRFTVAKQKTLLRGVGDGRELWLFVLNTATAYRTWEAVVPGAGDFGAHYAIGSNETALVIGPHFLRSATAHHETLHLAGDLNETTTIEVLCHPSYTSLEWNGRPVDFKGSRGVWRVTLPGPTHIPTAPRITGWKYQDGLPELHGAFDDSRWLRADKKRTTNPNQPYANYDGKDVLYGSDYGFAVGAQIWRGHFEGNGKEGSLAISLAAGTGGVGAFWLNDDYIGYGLVDKQQGVEDVNLSFPLDSQNVLIKTDNVVTVVIFPAAQEESAIFSATPADIQSPRGIRGYTLHGGSSSSIEWRVQGNLGGWTDFPDRLRSVFNVGGTFGERSGWHLPECRSCMDGSWEEGGPDAAWSGPGIRFFRGEVNVEYPHGLDIHYSFVFPQERHGVRALLYVNGWQYGQYFGDYGPQSIFPVPPGILVDGANTIALVVFAYNKTNAALDLQLRVDQGVVTTELNLAEMSMSEHLSL